MEKTFKKFLLFAHIRAYSRANFLRIASRENQPGSFIQAEHQIHILHRLPGCAFDEIVNRRKNRDLLSGGMRGDVAKIGRFHPINVGRAFNQTHKKRFLVKIVEYMFLLQFLPFNARQR